MTLLLDAEARLFVIPEETRAAPEPRRPREAARHRAATPTRALPLAPDATPVRGATPTQARPLAPDATPVREASPARALSPVPAASPARALSPAPAASPAPATTPSVAPLPEPATWAGAGEQRRTLDDLLSASWEGLSADAAVAACPVCDGELVRRWSAGAGVVGGRCRDCGSELS